MRNEANKSPNCWVPWLRLFAAMSSQLSTTCLRQDGRRRHGTRANGLACVLLTLLCLALPSCTPASIPPDPLAAITDNPKSRGLIVGFEGLQPFSGFSVRNLVLSVGQDLGLVNAATSGHREAHLPIIEAAARAGLPIYIVGYSMGGQEARRLAELCRDRNIPVRILFLLDPGYLVAKVPDKVPDNVARAVFYTSPTYRTFVGTEPKPIHLADPAKTAFASEYFSNSDHTTLPTMVTDRIRKEVAADLAKCNRRVGASTGPDVP